MARICCHIAGAHPSPMAIEGAAFSGRVGAVLRAVYADRTSPADASSHAAAELAGPGDRVSSAGMGLDLSIGLRAHQCDTVAERAAGRLAALRERFCDIVTDQLHGVHPLSDPGPKAANPHSHGNVLAIAAIRCTV